MLTKRIIPCLDVAAGRVVKGINFVDLRDAGDPVELAAFYNSEGADEIVFLDITASYENRATMLDVVRRTAEQVFIPVTVGGGIRSVEDIRATLGAGADKTSLNTAAVQRPELLRAGAEQFGAQCIVLAIDARTNPTMPSGYEVFIHGGRTPTGMDVLEWAWQGVALGAGEILLTSMDRDGTQRYRPEATRRAHAHGGRLGRSCASTYRGGGSRGAHRRSARHTARRHKGQLLLALQGAV